MIIFALVAAVFLYIGLYFAWAMAQSHIGQTLSWISLLNEMMLVPQHAIFFILRGFIIILFFYVIADFFYASARQGLKSAAKDKRGQGGEGKKGRRG